MGLGKQAKILTKAQVDAALNYLSSSRYPRQRGDLLRPEPGLYGQQQDRAVPMGVAGTGEVVESGVDLRLRQGLRLLAESHGASRLMIVRSSGAEL